jgi:hypothetical protein
VTVRAPALVVIGGGEVGERYVRQLLRAVSAGRLETERIVVVDRDRDCAARVHVDPRLRFDVEEWSDWLDANLDLCGPDDHVVPYHWAPHLFLDWLRRQVARAGARARTGGEWPLRGTPYEGATAAGDRALSYATWPCPPMCIEPALCPHTLGPKSWSLAADLDAPRAGESFDGHVVFRCLHLVYGVGTTPVAAIRAARDRLVAGLRTGRRTYLVSTASHCHGLATPLTIER